MRERPMADLVARCARSVRGVGRSACRSPRRRRADRRRAPRWRPTCRASSPPGLLLAAPAMADGLQLRLRSAPVSRPYLELTVDVMRAFDAHVVGRPGLALPVAPGGYRATTSPSSPMRRRPRTSSPPPPSAAARVTCPGWAGARARATCGFVDLLARMGADGRADRRRHEVRGAAAVARDRGRHGRPLRHGVRPSPSWPRSPTRRRGHRHRVHPRQGDRPRRRRSCASCAACGIDADEEADGFVVRPGPSATARRSRPTTTTAWP